MGEEKDIERLSTMTVAATVNNNATLNGGFPFVHS